MGDVPFWSDDFDMDLPKIFPDARRLLGDLGDIELVTVGKPDKNGRLNHPAVWNGDHSMLSFFGFKSPRKPEFYWSSDGLVRCTAWEAFRDAWSHNYLIQVEQRPVWDTGPLWRHFETIMWRVRGWGLRTEEQEKAARRVMLRSYCAGISAFGRVVETARDAPARARRG